MPISLKIFPSELKFNRHFDLPSNRVYLHIRYKIIHMTRQLCCRGMCKNFLANRQLRIGLQQNELLSFERRMFSEMDPLWHISKCSSLAGDLADYMTDGLLFMMTSSNGNIFRVTDQWRGALMFSCICVWRNGWVNNRKTGDLRRYRVHDDVTVMLTLHVAQMHDVYCSSTYCSYIHYNKGQMYAL